MDVKYPHVKVPLVGQDGNAFVILGRMQRALRHAKVPQAEIDDVMADAQSGDYDHLLQVVMRTVETFDEDDG